MHHPPAKWSVKTTKVNNSSELDEGVFTWNDPQQIARSLKRTAEGTRRRKGSLYQTAAAFLNSYIETEGAKVPVSQKHILEQAKKELRTVFGIE